MTDPIERTALITGASSGIGAVFAGRLARRGYHLVLVARRADRLAELANRLSSEYGIRAEILPTDLSDLAALQVLEEHIRSTPSLTMLVNNAGFAFPGRFDKVPVEQHIAMLNVHVAAAVRLTHAALPGMIARKEGAIINVSSVAAFTPHFSGPSYSPSKAYLNAFSQALQSELSGKGIRVQALCPGFTHTEFHDEPALKKMKSSIPGFLWLTAESVVDGSLRAIDRGGGVYVPGIIYKFIPILARCGLLDLAARLGGAAYLRRKKPA